MKRTLTLLLAMLMLFSSALFLIGCSEDEPGDTSTVPNYEYIEEEYDYLANDLTPFITLKPEDYKGLALALKGYKPTITEEEINEYYEDYLRYLYKDAVDGTKKQYLSAVGNTDEIVISYYTKAYDDTLEIKSKKLSNSNVGLVLGAGYSFWEKTIEEALVGLVPAKKVEGDDALSAKDHLVIVDYTVTYQYDKDKDGTAETLEYKKGEGEAVDLGVTSGDIVKYYEKFLGKKRGDVVSFEIADKEVVVVEKAEGVEEVKAKVTLSVSATVTDILAQNEHKITVTLPNDFFSEGDENYDLYKTLNGQEVIVYVTIESAVDYELAAETIDFILGKGKCQYVPEGYTEDDYDEYYAKYKDMENGFEVLKAEFLESREKYLREENDKATIGNNYADIWNAVLDKAVIHSYPDLAYRAYYQNFFASLREYYDLAQVSINQGATFETFAVAMANQQYQTKLTTFEELQTYVKNMCEGWVKEELVRFTIQKAENITLSDEEFEEGYQEVLEEELYYAQLNYYYGYSSVWYNTVEEIEKAINDYYGEGVFQEQVRDSLLFNKVMKVIYDSAVKTEKTEDKNESGSAQ